METIQVSKILDKIESPSDLKGLSREELGSLCEELREYIVSVVSKTGGHLAPSLGVIELTVVLHCLYDMPDDVIIWDVGHQSYCHKILTGRKEEFKNLRQYGGLTGFTSRAESQYDSFGTGHASTSISAAMGFAMARDRMKRKNKVIAVIGDGALTGGLAYEGLNNAGASGTDLTVILNDNKMSISPNVGAMARYLTNIITNPVYNRIKSEIWQFTHKVPAIGEHVRILARRLQDSLKNLITPGLLFEELGFRYFGPIDGHNFDELFHTLKSVKEIPGPNLVHVLTVKGKGYPQAEKDSAHFHGVGSFCRENGKSNSKGSGKMYTKVFGKALVEAGAADERIIAISAAMPDGTGLKLFKEKFPDRFYDVGIAEAHAVTFASGLAASGLRPVVAIYSTFMQRALDQLIHDVALQSLPVIFVLDRGGLVGKDGPTHHGVFDISYLSMIPNFIVSSPKDANELRNLLTTAIRYEKGPFSIRYPRDKVVGISDKTSPVEIPVGSWEELARGEDVAILAVGSMVYPALEAGEILLNAGVSAGVINCRFIKPLDRALLEEIATRYRSIVTVEENTCLNGFGSQVGTALQQINVFRGSILNLGIPDHFILHGSRNQLLEILGLTPDKIAESVLNFVKSEVGQQSRNI
jgi:1-deoxy-D-xylulose-5-phosphate synthase